MGSARTNYDNDAYKRGGWDDVARRSQTLWVAGNRDEAVAMIPNEMVIQANLLGDEAAVRGRLRTFRDAGVTTIRLSPAGANATARLDTLGRTLELMDELD